MTSKTSNKTSIWTRQWGEPFASIERFAGRRPVITFNVGVLVGAIAVGVPLLLLALSFAANAK